jgi:solute carrier family 6 GABA transporter-like protein 6/8/11/12/13
MLKLSSSRIPLLFMELAVGQYTRRGPIGALQKMCPILKGESPENLTFSEMH